MGTGEMVLQPSALIVAENAEFARTIMARWQTERTVPAFILIGAQVWNDGLSGVGMSQYRLVCRVTPGPKAIQPPGST